MLQDAKTSNFPIQELFDAAERSVNTRAKLRKRLHAARKVLVDYYLKVFPADADIDYANRRMYSIDGKWALQWKNTGETNCGSCTVERIPEPPGIQPGYRTNLETLLQAAGNQDLALLSARRRDADYTPVVLVCAMTRDGEDICPVPLAVMIDGNPYEMFTDPTVID